MTRGGADKAREDGAERKCIATGDVQPKFGLIRFVVGPDNQIVPDLAESCRDGESGWQHPGRPWNRP